MDMQAVILAAGKGSRMHSSRIKVLHEVLGRTMLDRVIDAARRANAERVVVVVGHDRDEVEERLGARDDSGRLHTAVQAEQKGTGHAVWCARTALDTSPHSTYTLILYGDVPNLSGETLRSFVEVCTRSEAKVGVMTAILDDAHGYGRIVRDDHGEVTRIVEHADASGEEREILEINTGIYVVETSFLLSCLDEICSGDALNAQGEYYLTDVVAMGARDSSVFGWSVETPGEIQGVNTRVDLAHAARFARERFNTSLMTRGVELIDPATTYIEESVEIEPDATIYPNVHLRGATTIAAGAIVEPNCVLTDTTVGEGAHILPGSVLSQASVGSSSAIGPMAHLRPGADIGSGCKIGNFVEIKKARLDDGAKAGHLSYLGDAHIGSGANVGAGTITCNYDGERKHRTTIGQGAFIGSNTALVAPVEIEDGAYVAAGSTITQHVPKGALGVGRGRQRNIEGWVERTKRPPKT